MNCRQWGYYDVLLDEGNLKVKKLVVSPNCSTSLQRHFKRSEDWIYISGEGKYTVDGFTTPALGVVHVPIGCWHQISAGERELVLIEIQRGSECIEEDIERYS